MTTDDRSREGRLQVLLSEAAAAARPPRPWGDFVVGARRSLRVRRVLAVGAAVGIVLLAVPVATQLDMFGLPTEKNDPAGPPGSTTNQNTFEPRETIGSTPASPEPCDFPDHRPTYLPWLGVGEEVGPPIRDRAESGDEDSDFATLLWPRDQTDPDSDYVSLFTQTAEGAEAHGKIVDVEINGEKGRFEIAPGGDDATITWLVGSGRCNVTVLTLRTSGWDDSKLEEEITRVARSLADDR